ncbi:hypothetical protein ABEB36_015736 [Hypothenemus hampei]|uniref:Uncharacterized protein n=1 Tax=Hypothenemus hampei TaxID=57062 RepID=A0ABD1DZ50_HYPHA
MISSSTSTPSSSSSSSSERSTIASTSIKRTGGNVNVNSVIEKSSLLIRNLQRLLNEKTPSFGDELQKVWLKKLNYEIVSCNRVIRQRSSLSVGIRCKLQTNIELMKSFKKKILRIHEDLSNNCNNQQQQQQRVAWENIETCFRES